MKTKVIQILADNLHIKRILIYSNGMEMKIIILLSIIFTHYTYSQQFGFVNGASTNANTFAKSIVLNNSNHLVACGAYTGGPNYEGTTLTSTGSWNGFLAKYDLDGNIIWVQAGIGTSNTEIHDVTVDSDDNIYICGYIRGNSNFDGLIDSSPNEQNGFAAKYDSDGNIIWFEKFGSTSRNDATKLEVDSEGNVFVAGYFQGTTEFVSSTLTSTGGSDAFLIKLDTDGNEEWIKTGDGTDSGSSRDVAVDGDDNIYWVGGFRTSIDFTGNILNSGGGNSDMFVVKLNNSGTVLLEFNEGTTAYEIPTSIYVDSGNNMYIAGYIDNNSNFGGIALTRNGLGESVVMKYNSSGVIQWAKSIGGDGNYDQAADVFTDSEGNVYVAGFYQGTLVSVNASITSTGDSDMYLSRFDNDGNYDWTLTAAGDSGEDEQINGITIDEYNNVYLFGYMTGSVDFSGTIVNSGTGNNVFLASAYVLTPAGISTSDVLTDGPFKANGGGNVTTNGNSEVTAKGIVWGTSSSPTIALNTKTTSAGGTGSFTGQMTGLTPGIQYYYRAYATNDQGTYYGAELTFFTSAYIIPLDGNQDNIRDTDQNHVNTFLSSNNVNYLTILSDNSMTINDVSNYNISEDDEYVYPFGVTEFKINATQTEVKIYFHEVESLDGYIYRKKFPDGTFREFDNVTYSTEIVGGNRVAVATLALTDGGPGDYDGIVNGVIYDPGGPALPITANIPIWDWWWIVFVIFGLILIYYKSKYHFQLE